MEFLKGDVIYWQCVCLSMPFYFKALANTVITPCQMLGYIVLHRKIITPVFSTEVQHCTVEHNECNGDPCRQNY